MIEEAIRSAEACTPRKPKVNKRDVNLNGSKEIPLEDRTHNPTTDAILVTGFERSIQEYSEIGASSLKKE